MSREAKFLNALGRLFIRTRQDGIFEIAKDSACGTSVGSQACRPGVAEAEVRQESFACDFPQALGNVDLERAGSIFFKYGSVDVILRVKPAVQAVTQ